MIILDATTKSLQFKLGAAATTNQLPFAASYVDTTGTATTPGEQDGVSNNTTAVTVVSAPASSTQRLVKNILIQNADTVAATVTVIYNNNSTLRNVIVVTLAVGDQLIYEDGNGWSAVDANGNLKTSGSGSGGVTSVSNSDGTLTISPTTGSVVASLASLASGKILVGNASNIAAAVSVSGDATISNTGVLTVTKTNGTAFAPSATVAPVLHNQFFTSTGSNTFTTPAATVSTTVFKFTLTGGGGGGGGAATGSAAGGGGGTTAIYVASGLSASTGYTITIGAGGSAGSSAGGSGGTGGTSSVVIGATTVSAPGGSGGGGGASNGVGTPGNPGGAATNATLSIQGGGGAVGSYDGGTLSYCSGTGGGSFWGGGARAINGLNEAPANGIAGLAYGSGGGGALNNGSTNAGGAGANGVCMVEWVL